MISTPGPDLQCAIAFLSTTAFGSALPATPDYEALARRAGESGYELSPGAVEEAFRLIMSARLLVLRKMSEAEGHV